MALSVESNSEEKAKDYLLEHGFKNITVGGYNWFCAKGTLLRRNFEATDHSGQEVEGSMCAGRLFFSDSIETKSIKKAKM